MPEKPLYTDKEIEAARLIDDMKQVQNYHSKILEKMKNLYLRRKLDIYDYCHVVNLLTVNDLKIKQISDSLDKLLENRSLTSIDMKI